MYTFCLLFSYLIKVVALLYFICCYQQVLVNKDIQNVFSAQRTRAGPARQYSVKTVKTVKIPAR